MQNTLFDNEIPKNTDPIDNLNDITTTILYMSTTELKEFRKLCKIGIKEMFGADFQTKGNITDLILFNLRKLYGEWKD